MADIKQESEAEMEGGYWVPPKDTSESAVPESSPEMENLEEQPVKTENPDFEQPLKNTEEPSEETNMDMKSGPTYSSKHPVMLLNEMKRELKYEVTGELGELPDKVFEVGVTIEEQTFVGSGRSKKLAKQDAARIALEKVFNIIYSPDAVQTSKMSSGSWTREATALLIQHYRDTPCLYEVENANYRNKKLRKEALERIVEYVREKREETSVEDVKNKMNGLRTQYLNELVRMKKKGGSVQNGDYKPKLSWFSELSFLKNDIMFQKQSRRLRSTEDNLTHVLSESNESAGNDSAPSQIFSVCHVGQAGNKRACSDEENIVQTSVHLPSDMQLKVGQEKSHALKEDDQYEIFGKFVASEIRMIKNIDVYMQVKRKIQIAILEGQEADLNRRSDLREERYVGPTRVHCMNPVYSHMSASSECPLRFQLEESPPSVL